MSFIIITTRNLLWLLLSLAAVMAIVAGIITPKWLVGYERTDTTPNITTNAYSPSVGLYNRCSRLALYTKRPLKCVRFVQSWDDIPSSFWKASLIFMVLGGGIAALCVLMAFVGLCVQNIGKKSLFSVVGVIQAVAGLLLVVGLVLYPAGWGGENKVVKSICHKPKQSTDNPPSPFKLGDCQIGWAMYSVLGGTLLLFLCAVFSAQAEKSTSSDRVQDEIFKGKTVICLP